MYDRNCKYENKSETNVKREKLLLIIIYTACYVLINRGFIKKCAVFPNFGERC